MFNHPVSNSKGIFLFLNLELVTRKRNNKNLTFELGTHRVTFYFSTSN